MSILTQLNRGRNRRSVGIGLALAASLAAAGYVGLASNTSQRPSPPAAAAVTATAKVTIETASVAGLGTVLVDGAGRTIYTLSSEKHGKITCTSASGCPQFWPQIHSSSGQRHQTRGGAHASMIGSERGATSTRVVTYHGWPLYTYSGDSAKGQDNGEGLKSFGGTWYAVSPAGKQVKGAAKASKPSPSSGGYSY
ncbi:MAG TPA: hypothetical protein VMW80_10300 [Candidatus Dormibacteraeota bacterium]|nr:hypothetical protein [Candidatus Dormibacteraeota bacterium]